MKKYLLILLILALGCQEEVQKIEIDKIVPENITVIEIEEPIIEKKVILPEYVDVVLKLGNFDQGFFELEDVYVKTTQKIRWTNNNQQAFQMACYQDGKRMFLGNRVLPGKTNEFTFNKIGEYFCQDIQNEASHKVFVD